ncbi:hypothetical protein [Burkholderia pseudomallei]|uniref:hypothetical protein n=1 Tax=Burkholderia pseudomallei TaxID=28450 RepID=UPI000F161682|nr:hypothetical protein [Burkholderia pseudomallei]MBF3420289.1 hypothetical protein [Burkholderia pseudomallei]MBF3431422.1 hypothetical protein [Burkholderia pseudomallei]MBF3724759.1 hypothetical protein [Burkholderia pseudomallei]MBF3734268.1 hypothetical protein [Burkholderia pseudomallei]MBF3849537.1 hypothetical protein [Burkholderia pseudomallei]
MSNLDHFATALTERFKQGPGKPSNPKPGQFHAEDDDWWGKFWRRVTKQDTGEDTHKLEKDVEQADSPERRRAAKCAHDMTTKELVEYKNAKGWGPYNQSDDTVGEQMIRDVVRKELVHRGRNLDAYF